MHKSITKHTYAIKIRISYQHSNHIVVYICVYAILAVVLEHVFDWNIFILNMAFLRLPVSLSFCSSSAFCLLFK